jgi:hypothetical protein
LLLLWKLFMLLLRRWKMFLPLLRQRFPSLLQLQHGFLPLPLLMLLRIRMLPLLLWRQKIFSLLLHWLRKLPCPSSSPLPRCWESPHLLQQLLHLPAPGLPGGAVY